MGNRTTVSKYTSGNVLKYTHTYTYDSSNRMETDADSDEENHSFRAEDDQPGRGATLALALCSR
jgi:hypothetical protein